MIGEGISGSWVVRGNKLCGVIYAAYDGIPYLHMIPAETIFGEIRRFKRATSWVEVSTVGTAHATTRFGAFASNTRRLIRSVLRPSKEPRFSIPTLPHRYSVEMGVRARRFSLVPGDRPSLEGTERGTRKRGTRPISSIAVGGRRSVLQVPKGVTYRRHTGAGYIAGPTVIAGICKSISPPKSSLFRKT